MPAGRGLPDAIGDFSDKLAAEAVLEAIEDFFAAVANDFAKPNTAIHADEEGAIADAAGLGVGGNGRVEEMVPDFGYFSLSSPAVDAQLGEDVWENGVGLAGAEGLGFF